MLSVDNLSKLYANATDAIAGGIREASFDIEPGGFFTLLGPSGCGKTTTLRCVAGLEKPDGGTVRLGERTLFDGAARLSVPMNLRDIGMVFQSYAIWPHMNVFENVAFPLTVSKTHRYAAADIRSRVDRALATVGLDGYGKRPATRLSGGEQQRVALARAIVGEPQLLLLDEPLSNLDANLREEMRTELKRLQRRTGITTVYVTHDQAEALSLSDRIAVIEKGRIVQLDTPEEIYFRPRTAFVAGFVGATNLVEGRTRGAAVADAPVGVALDTGEEIRCRAVGALGDGMRVVVSIRPETVTIEAAGDPVGNPAGTPAGSLAGRIEEAGFQGQTRSYDVVLGTAPGTWRMQVLAPPEVRFVPGDAVRLGLSADRTIAVAAEGA